MKEHTPGPWTTAEYDDRLMINGVRGFVCTMDQPTGPEQQANASLIAAAPDLLAALKNVVADILDYERINNLAPSPGKKYCWQSVAQADAAIAKAESRALIAHQDEQK